MMVNSLKESFLYIKDRLKVIGKQKIFCIGHNKTGTTSIKRALADHGYLLGDQRKAELLIDAYKERDFISIINYCKTALAFQDVPFSLYYTYVALDQAFPGSKFILTQRDSAEQWYNSLVRFQTKKFGVEGNLPTKQDLIKANYRFKGFVYKTKNLYYGVSDNDLYNKEKLINYYNTHNSLVKEYFRFRPHDLLVLNVSNKGSYQQLCEFLGKQPLYDNFPWENKTENI